MQWKCCHLKKIKKFLLSIASLLLDLARAALCSCIMYGWGKRPGQSSEIFWRFLNKKCKKPYRNYLYIFLVALHGSEYYCEEFIRSSLFWILLKNQKKSASGGRLPIGREVAGAVISRRKVKCDLNFQVTCNLMQWEEEDKHSRER